VAESDDVAAVVRAIVRSSLQPSALDVLHPGRVAVLFEGSAAAVAAQVAQTGALVGAVATGAELWNESRERQHAARGRRRFSPGDLPAVLRSLETAIVRPAAGIAYVPHEVASDLSEGERRLNQAIKVALDPEGILT
jgi:hypothetical protein